MCRQKPPMAWVGSHSWGLLSHPSGAPPELLKKGLCLEVKSDHPEKWPPLCHLC